MIKVVVAYGTKMGATKEIAEAIGDELKSAAVEVTVSDAADLRTLDGYDAAVVGSAVYMARWRPEAVELLTRQAKSGTSIPIWTYQSGPLSTVEEGTDQAMPRKVREVAARIGAAPPVTFGGRVEPATAKGFIARKMAAGPSAGDYRDFDEIRRWARGIGAQLVQRISTAPTISRPV